MFAFCSIPVCRNGRIEAAALDGFDYYLSMNKLSGQSKGYNVLQRQVIVGNDGTTATECYLARREDQATAAKFAFPYNTTENETDCAGRVVSCRGHGLTDYLSWEKTAKFVPTGSIEIYGAVPATYSVQLLIKRYEARGGCWGINNKADYLQLVGYDVLSGWFILSEVECSLQCGVATSVNLDFLLDPEKNDKAPDWNADGVAWDEPTLTLQCLG